MATAKKSSRKKTAAVPAKATKKPAAKTVKATKAKTVRKKVSNKVDYYPNRMTFWVSAAAGSLIVLIAVIVAYS